MKLAFALWKHRIAPVFDTARHVRVVEVKNGRIDGEISAELPEAPGLHKALRLAELGTETLVCGAISRLMQEMIIAYGIQVVSFVAGDFQEVIQAWLQGNRLHDRFAMPGCRKRGRKRFRGMPHTGEEEYSMNGKGRGRGQGSGRGQGQGRQRPGRMDGQKAAGPSGYCVCPQCGQREPHQVGTPCVARKCPQCGTAMTRE